MYYANSEGAYLITSAGKTMMLPLPGMPRFSKPNIEVKDLDDEYANSLDARLRKNSGSVALSMVQLAAGSYNGLILSPLEKEGKSDTCDIAAGYYIMKQSGLYVADYKLNPFDYRHPNRGIIALDDTINNEASDAIRNILEREKVSYKARQLIGSRDEYINGHDEECMVAS